MWHFGLRAEVVKWPQKCSLLHSGGLQFFFTTSPFGNPIIESFENWADCKFATKAGIFFCVVLSLSSATLSKDMTDAPKLRDERARRVLGFAHGHSPVACPASKSRNPLNQHIDWLQCSHYKQPASPVFPVFHRAQQNAKQTRCERQHAFVQLHFVRTENIFLVSKVFVCEDNLASSCHVSELSWIRTLMMCCAWHGMLTVGTTIWCGHLTSALFFHCKRWQTSNCCCIRTMCTLNECHVFFRLQWAAVVIGTLLLSFIRQEHHLFVSSCLSHASGLLSAILKINSMCYFFGGFSKPDCDNHWSLTWQNNSSLPQFQH